MENEPILEIVKIGDEILKKNCRKVDKFDDSLSLLTEAMLTTLEEVDGVGLAAPQIGVDGRFFVVDIRDGKKYVFINPEILETSEEVGPYEEGCLSLPGVYHEVIRPLRVTVYAQDVTGKGFTIEADGLLARVIQHENDHLNGHMFIDRLSDEEKVKVLRAYERKSGEGRKSKRRKN